MHTEAFEFVRGAVEDFGPFAEVWDIGGRNVNGSPRELFGSADYRVLDIAPGPGVDVVADAAEWAPDAPVDCVVCCEVFEHTPRWPEILDQIWRYLSPWPGVLIATMATDPRVPHSAVDGQLMEIDSGEFYENVTKERLWEALMLRGFTVLRGGTLPRGDLRVVACL